MTELHGPPLADAKDVGALTLGGFLLEVCGRFADREAVVFDDPLRGGATVRWTYADLEREARRVARALLALGAGKGTRVGILMSNRPEALAALFGAGLVGAVAAPLSTFAPGPELAALLRLTATSVLLTQSRMGRHAFADEVRALCTPPYDVALPHLRQLAAVGEASWDELLQRGEAVPAELVDAVAAEVAPSDLGLVICSSGTTSAPKGVLHDNRAPTLQLWLQAQVFARTPDTRMWTALPLFWTAGLNTAIGATLAAGGCCVLQEGFDAGAALALLERERVTEPYTLPHQAKALEEHPSWAGTDLSSVTKAYGKSVFPRHPTVPADPHWNMPVGYGLSETCSFFAAHPSDTDRQQLKASTGRLLPGNVLRVVDPDTGATLGPGEVGELCVQGPTLMRHYLGKTREECFDADGFFHTGDVGWYDEDGFLHWTGRITEVIRTGGANVSPAEIEVALRACPPVKLARVVGVPDPDLGQLVVLCVVLKDGATATEAELQDFLRARLSAYKVPKRVLLLDEAEMPMTGSGAKVRDDALIPIVQNRLQRSSP